MLEIRNIVKNYGLARGHNAEALRGVSFVFPERGMVFVVGKSGSGKSTLLNILGLLDNYGGGEYLIDGKCSKDFTEQEKSSFRAGSIGFVFQEFHIINEYTVGQNVSLPLEIQKNKNDGAVAEVLGRVGLEGFGDRRPSQLSGGQKQRVAIARAIIKNPRIVLADEPTGSLDSVTGTEIFDTLRDLGRDRLVIVVSHDIESAHKYADQIIELKDGQIDGVYKGGGGAGQVRVTVNKMTPADIAKSDEILDGGKKITITKPAKPAGKKPETAAAAPLDTAALPLHLPFRSALKLSLYSMKTKWVRTLFTVLIAMFAIAFFGFADIIAQFDINDVVLQDADKGTDGFINVGVEQIEQNGLTAAHKTVSFTEPQIQKFGELGLDAYPRRKFFRDIYPMYKKYEYFLPEESQQYYTAAIPYYTECDDFSKLGLKLIAGREPRLSDSDLDIAGGAETFEMVITTHQMECYKLFGFFNNSVNFDSVTDFTQIQNQTVFREEYTALGVQLRFKIVGLVEVDTSKYRELAAITEKVGTLTKEQETLYRRFHHDWRMLFGNAFVAPGFFDRYYLGAGKFTLIEHEFSYDGRKYNEEQNFDRLLPGEFSMSRCHFAPGVTDLADDMVVLDYRVLYGLFPEVENITNQEEALQYFDEHIANKTVHLKFIKDTGIPAANYAVERDLRIAGVYVPYTGKWIVSFVTEKFFADTKTSMVGGYKVSAASEEERRNVINSVSNFGAFDAAGGTYRLFLNTPDYLQLRQLHTHFVLFVNIFYIISIVLFAFAVLLTYIFISQSIALRKKDIGILRSLGARKKDVANIFIIEGAVIAALKILLGIVTCYIGYRVLTGYIAGRFGTIAAEYRLLTFGLRQAALMSVLAVTAVAVPLVFPIRRILRKSPAETIRSS